MQAAGRAGRFAGTVLDDFGQTPRSDKDNIQPRLGAVYDLRGDGRDIVRGGWGIYTDFGYTNCERADHVVRRRRRRRHRLRRPSTRPACARRRHASSAITDPLSTIAHLNGVPAGPPPAGEVVSPRLRAAVLVSDERRLGAPARRRHDGHGRLRACRRARPERAAPSERARQRARATSAGFGIAPNNSTFRVAVSQGTSRYDALILAVQAADVARRRPQRVVHAGQGDERRRQRLATSSRSNLHSERAAIRSRRSRTAPSVAHRRAPSRDAQRASSRRRSDSACRRSSSIARRCRCTRAKASTSTATARPTTSRRWPIATPGWTENGVATFEEDGPCETVNCSRRAPFSQLNLRVSRAFRLGAAARDRGDRRGVQPVQRQEPVPAADHDRRAGGAAHAGFMQPTGYAGDVGQPEQRVGQLGFRITF